MKKQKILALLTEDEAKSLEAQRTILSSLTKGCLIAKDCKKWKEWNIELVNQFQSIFRCKSCGATWSPNLQENGKVPHDYWQCPTGCNK